MAETIIGITGKDFVLIAADASAGFSIIIMKDNEDKILEMDRNKLLAANGEAGDRVAFTQFIQKNLTLYRHRNYQALGTHAAAHFLRNELASALRRGPYNANLLLGGYDERDGPELFYIDYLASLQKVNFGAHGYGSYFCLSILDKYYKKDMTLEEAKVLMKRCLEEVQKRLVLSSPKFIIKVVDKEGTRRVHLRDVASGEVLKQQQQRAYATVVPMPEYIERFMKKMKGIEEVQEGPSPLTGLEKGQFSQKTKPSAKYLEFQAEGKKNDAKMAELSESTLVRRVLYNKRRPDDLNVDFKNPEVMMEWVTKFAREGPREYVDESSLLKPEPAVVTVTGAAGSIAYNLLMRIANGEMFGKNQPIILKLLDTPEAMKALEGVVMELQDTASPVIHKIIYTADQDEAFTGCDYAILLGAKPRGPGMERSDLLKANAQIFADNGKALNKNASKDVLVCVVGNPANTNALIAATYAADIPREHFSAMTRLDHERGLNMIAKKFDVKVNDVSRFAVWGNHSSTMVPDFNHVTIRGRWARKFLGPQADEWIYNEFVPAVQNRGAEVIAARGKSSAASAADAVVKHMRDWVFGNPDWTSMAIYSDGLYGMPHGYFISMPVVCTGVGEVKVVNDLPMTNKTATLINASVDELIREKLAVEEILPPTDIKFYSVSKEIYSPSFFVGDESRVSELEALAKQMREKTLASSSN